MESAPIYTAPKTFVQGGEYLHSEHGTPAQGPTLQPVQFIKYDPCPAFIIVSDGNGRRWRCPREELFVGLFAQGRAIS